MVRHGESEGNALRLAQGRSAHPLTPRGRAQAGAVAALARGLRWRPGRVVTSPLPRCTETAGILAEALAAPAPLEDVAFTEIDCGRATGVPFETLRRDHPEAFARPVAEWGGFEAFGGESPEALFARVARGLDALPRGEAVLLVTHGAVFKAVLAHLVGLRARLLLDLRNGTCLRLERRGGAFALTHFLHAEEWAASVAAGGAAP